MHDETYIKTIASPVGYLTLMANDRALTGVYFENSRYASVNAQSDHPVLLKAEKQLAEYFAGARHQFDVPLHMHGTVFQQKTWRELQRIPYGQTISYGQQATRMGDSKKARAVGMANGRNPISIIVPCHRVIGSSGALVGFGGGIKTKQYLLGFEQNALKKAA